MMVYCLYQTTNLINGNIYVGVHKSNGTSDKYMGSGKLLKQAIKKYGINNFVCNSLFEFKEEKQAYFLEKLIVNENFINRKDTYNLVLGGKGSSNKNYSNKNGRKKGFLNKNKGKKLEEIYDVEKANIIKNKISEFRKGNSTTKKGVFKHSDETKAIISTKNKGKIISKESRLKMSNSRIGKIRGKYKTSGKYNGDKSGIKNSQYGTMWVQNHTLKQNKKIKEYELEKYLIEGWEKGFTMIYFPKKGNL